MNILKNIVITLAAIVVLFFVVGFFLPDSVHVERSAVIDAPAGKIFPLINDYKNFNKWSPWYRMEPDATYTITPNSSGVGARMTWEGEIVDTGSQEIVASTPNESVRTSLDFGGQGTATAELRLAPQGAGTKVTWAMDAQFGNNMVQRWFGLMMDRWVGGDYEKGLGYLKELAES